MTSPTWLARPGGRTLLLGGTAILAFVVVGLAGPWLVPFDPSAQNIIDKLRAPSGMHLMGTDELGRDMFSRVIVGAQVSLAAGIGASLLGALSGSAVGIAAAYFGGIGDEILMRIVDVLIAFPAIILAMAVVAVAGSSLPNVVWVLAVVQLPIFARLARAVVLAHLSSDYIAATRTVGVAPARIVLHHLVPNSLAPIVAMTGLVAAGSILNEAALSFLGLGVVPPTPSWGNLLAGGRVFILVGAWWLTVFPGFAIFLTVLAFNVTADGLRDLLDPRLHTA